MYAFPSFHSWVAWVIGIPIQNLVHRPAVHRISNIMQNIPADIDIIVAQEVWGSANIESFLADARKLGFVHSVVGTVSTWWPLLGSGLVTVSKIPIEYSMLGQYTQYMNDERFCAKGFILTRINNMVIGNTHLQSGLTAKTVRQDQIRELIRHTVTFKEPGEACLIAGDFNRDPSLAATPFNFVEFAGNTDYENTSAIDGVLVTDGDCDVSVEVDRRFVAMDQTDHAALVVDVEPIHEVFTTWDRSESGGRLYRKKKLVLQ